MTRRRGPRPSRALRPVRRVVEGAGGIVVNDGGDVLLIRHRNGSWVFPKGHIEAGESKVDAAVREVEEEAGVQATVVDPRQTWQTAYVNPRREGRRITWYLLRTGADEAVLREPIFPSGGFFTPHEALGMLAFEEDRTLLRHVLRAARRLGLIEGSGPDAGADLADGMAESEEDAALDDDGFDRAAEVAEDDDPIETLERAPETVAP